MLDIFESHKTRNYIKPQHIQKKELYFTYQASITKNKLVQTKQERIIEHRLWGVTNVTKNQFGFMPGRSTMEAIFLIRQLMERYREQKKDMHMVFIDLEKVYDKVTRNIM
jgi:phosphoheptose isomerase